VAHAAEALTLARACGEEELLREAHVLFAEIRRAAGDLDAAKGHLEQAISLRDQVAESLPADVRGAFLAQRSIAILARMSRELAEPAHADGADEAPRSIPAPRSTAALESRAPRELVGDDPAMRGLALAVKKVARSNATVLIRGESGTGKELVAEALHRASDRANGPLVTVNCGALVETLLLSELFGHEKGAFTGAFARRRGRFELADGGTLFLDEIGDISPRTQVALLRVLQERTFERVGGTTAIRANVRIVCATHRDLRAMVERGEFREDLYYRLRGITLEVPALRQRMGDLPRLGEHLLARIAVERNEAPKTLSPCAIELMSRHRWPGNVRELENALRAASLFAEGATITANDLVENVDDLRTVAQFTQAAQPPQAVPAPRPSVQDVSWSRYSLEPASTRAPLLPAPPTEANALPQDPPDALLETGERASLATPSGAWRAETEERVSVATPSLATRPETDDENESPLPAGECGATAVAYAQVRLGALSLSDMKRQIERDCIARALAETKGNITRAAALLGMKRPRLSQLVKQYGLAAVSTEVP
jgi:sigma-54 specific flagellar transcriptional regulator A